MHFTTKIEDQNTLFNRITAYKGGRKKKKQFTFKYNFSFN